MTTEITHPQSPLDTFLPTLKLPRAESPMLSGSQEQIEQLTRGLNRHIAHLVDTLKRWHDGGFGEEEGEDPLKAKEMQDFVGVSLERIQASFLVRVYTHLSRGTLRQSAEGCITGRSKSPPASGALEKAEAAGDTREVERLRSYLRVVDRASSGELPLKFLEDWRETLGNSWVEIIIDEAAQHLRSHVKLYNKWKADEEGRKDALFKFIESPDGTAYLEAREKHFPQGIPRAREQRFALYATPDLVKWRKTRTEFVPAGSERDLFEANPELVALRDLDTEYKRLRHPFTEPSWTRVSDMNLRWPFIPAKQFAKGGLSFNAAKQSFVANLCVPDLHELDGQRSIEVPLRETSRLSRNIRQSGPWSFEWADDITGAVAEARIKGMRFERSDGKWKARITYEKATGGDTEHVAEVRRAAKKKEAAPCLPGDVVCVFSLEPRTTSSKDGNRRAGWLKVVGVAKEGERVLHSGPVSSAPSERLNRRAFRRGCETFWGGKPGEGRRSFRASAHGPTKQVSLPQMLHIKRLLEQEVRIIRLLKDPQRVSEAMEWAKNATQHARERRDLQGNARAARYEAMLNCLGSGTPIDRRLLRPFQEKIRELRGHLQGQKRSYRHTVAKELLRAVHSVRSGSHPSPAISEFRNRNQAGQVLVVIEYHKGAGPGTLRSRPRNRSLSVLGPSEILALVEEKASFMTPPLPVIAISAKGIHKDCPDCGHRGAKAPSGPVFSCTSCGHKEPVVSLASANLTRSFLKGAPERSQKKTSK